MIFAFDSDVGCKRTNNEDFFYVPGADSTRWNIAVIADGMGGYNAGEIASQTAVASVVKYLNESDEITQNTIRSAIRSANYDIMELVKTDVRLKGMGTTMTVAAFTENQVIIGHVGDSRAYLISKNEIRQLTKDHSYVQMLVDSGEITLEEACSHEFKNVITRAVGVERRVRIDTYEYPLEPDDIVVMCTDGLTKYVSDDEILEEINGGLYDGMAKLMTFARDRGGDDNITLVAGKNTEILLDNRYRVLQQIGSGGMSKVYYAADAEDNNHPVTIKMLKQELMADEKMRDMFNREAKTAIKLKHKNIINAKRIVEEADQMYIVLDYVEGQNLKDYLEKHGPFPEETTINIALQVARALRYAHNNGYIHKDVKPQNIILDAEMNAFLTDFGLATKHTEDTGQEGDVVLGSVYYFSPEHAKGDTVNMRSDIYSLGIVIYEMLTGELPFKGESTHEVIMGHLHTEAVPPNEHDRNISVAISQVVLKAIDKDCTMRYVNFNNFMSDMKKALVHPHGGFVEYRSVPLATENSSFNWRKLVVGAAVMLSLVGVLLIISFFTKSEERPAIDFGMPNLVNMNMNDATGRLDDMDVQYRIEYYENDNVASGVVVDQSARAGTQLPPGTTIVLGIAINSKNSNLPDFYRANKDDAVAFLDSAGIANVDVKYVESELPYNFVVRQNPKPNTNMKDIKKVTLFVSNNEVATTVPRLIDLNLENAKSEATKNGFSIGIIYEEEGKPETVSRQLPVSGTRLVDHLAIDIWVGKNNNKVVPFSTTLDFTIREDDTKVIVCYEGDDGLLYYVNEFVLNTGIYQRNIKFNALTNSPKRLHIYYNNVKQRIIENVGASN